MDRSVDFYTSVLDFEKVTDDEAGGAERTSSCRRLRARACGSSGSGSATSTSSSPQYLAPAGRPAPADSRSNDRWFQHVAIIVSDMDRAYARLRQFKVQHASTGPQLLPKTIPNAAGIRAFYFRDPDGHPLEVLQFPPDKGDPKWHAPTDRLFLGIDHTAIVVGDTGASLAFYRDVLGFRVAGESMNFGTEQEHLNNVPGARLHITGLRAAAGPGIEFLEYLDPDDGRPYPGRRAGERPGALADHRAGARRGRGGGGRPARQLPPHLARAGRAARHRARVPARTPGPRPRRSRRSTRRASEERSMPSTDRGAAGTPRPRDRRPRPSRTDDDEGDRRVPRQAELDAPARSCPSHRVDEVPDGRGVLVKVLRVGVDGTDKEINAAEYGAAPPGYDFLVTGHESFGRVEAVGPERHRAQRRATTWWRRCAGPGSSIYDQIGTYDMTTDDMYYERGINLRHGYLTEYYVDDPEYIVQDPAGPQGRRRSCSSRPRWWRRASPRRTRSSGGSGSGGRARPRSWAPAPSGCWRRWRSGSAGST